MREERWRRTDSINEQTTEDGSRKGEGVDEGRVSGRLSEGLVGSEGRDDGGSEEVEGV